MKIYPSLISSDILNLQKTIEVFDPHCDGYHIDVMDFHFVPNLTWGPAFVNALTKATHHPTHVHLMVDNPAKWLDVLDLQEQDIVLFHYEALGHLGIEELIGKIQTKGWYSGIVINPETPADSVFPYLEKIDNVLVMSVKPGFSGQKFIPSTLEKVEMLVKERQKKNLSFMIGMDGGIGSEAIALAAKEHADYVAIASAIFGEADPLKAMLDLYRRGSVKG